ncbi:unnamed protein product [Clonostachys rosea]|uniref:NACHT domain-containing protein n=1 Tax=Bionectria ochroleuca TaxID=29856 RepID=A0ABY6UBZ2_BIOOC|nr:unnamed protein product [Clonostachys rosea]
MDPVSALGLAAAVVQFLSFAGTIFSSAAKIRSSSSGCSEEISSLEEIYERLRDFSGTLGTSYRQAVDAAPRTNRVQSEQQSLLADDMSLQDVLDDDILDRDTAVRSPAMPIAKLVDAYSSLQKLLSSCNTDCNKIMSIIQHLKAKNGNGKHWSSFKVALHTVWHRDEIISIESRLKNYQQMIQLEMSNLAQQANKAARIYHGIHINELASFKKESERLGIQQSNRLQSIECKLEELLQNKDAKECPNTTAMKLSGLENEMSELSIAQRNISREIQILRSLSFPSLTVRHKAIPQAHQETFEWVFEGPIASNNSMDGEASTDGNPNLLEWLQEGNRTFWVSGKPGSGKSTFMKFLADHLQTKNALSNWSRTLPVVTASHYFWSQGTQMQRSQHGLLQTLLFDIFRSCPGIIQTMCPTRWVLDRKQGQPPWEMPELRSTIQALSTHKGISCKFCFFIDGLDEYQGEHIDFCDDLISLLTSPNIKLCVSSRPWNVFEDAFGQDSRYKLYIHQLTEKDMLKYTKDRLQQHKRWKALEKREDVANSLIRSIVEKSKGVFLWVFIVTKLLREGLTNHDSFADLRRRLESFPSDLEPFFRQIIESVEPFYRRKMAESLQIALAAKEPLDALVYSFYDDHAENSDFVFHVAEFEDQAQEDDLNYRRETIIKRLNGWCRCLLEPNFLCQIDSHGC